MDVNEAAARLGVTPRRVRALISAGRLPAHKDAHRWVVESLRAPGNGRPLSEKSRAALAHALQYRTLAGLSGQERARTAARVGQLRASADPASLLASWWGGHSPEVRDHMSSLVANAIDGDRAFVRESLHRARREYLRKWSDVADVVSTERTIRRQTPTQLALHAGVPVRTVIDIERGLPIASLSALRKVLSAVDVTPTALPDMVLT